MNVLLIGGGGREHALAFALSKSKKLGTLYAAPGNAGIGKTATITPLDVSDHDAVIKFCRKHDIGLVVIGPEAPLVAGLADDLGQANIPVFGPRKEAAQLEGSKNFTKEICRDYNIPTADYVHFTDTEKAADYIKTRTGPFVIKADGLAAGKGVIISPDQPHALKTIESYKGGAFDEAGQSFIIEEFLEGTEASFFVICDGTTALPIGTAQDHKRAYDNDEGPNTGGMGAFSPSPHIDEAMEARVLKEIINPTLKAMNDKGTPFSGVLYAGLMLTSEGPKLIEYNVRFGDPECQVLMIRLNSDLIDLLHAAATGTLDQQSVKWCDVAAMTIVMATKGYPGAYEKGSVIKGLETAPSNDDAFIFHAATKLDDEGQYIANGGRVLNITATGKTLIEARSKAYEALKLIDWPEGFNRSDIGKSIET